MIFSSKYVAHALMMTMVGDGGGGCGGDDGTVIMTINNNNKKTPWSESASELYRSSDRHLSAK
jgi:hypothetical protein